MLMMLGLVKKRIPAEAHDEGLFGELVGEADSS